MSRASLSVVASALARYERSKSEGMTADAGFDGGEFSGPAHAVSMPREVRALLAVLGWTPEEFEAELEARTSARFAYFSGLGPLADVGRDDSA